MKILLCCNIPALSASSLQKKEEIKLCVKHRTLMKRLWKEEESNCLTLISIETKTIYIVSVFNCMEYIIVDCMLELVIHHFSLQLKTIILNMNNYLSIYPKYKLLSEIEPDSGRLNGECTNEYRANITMVKGGWYFCTHQKLAFIPISG